MRVLVTGSNGQVGFALKQKLEYKTDLMALTREMLDITDASAVNRVVSDFKPHFIINAAAYTAVDKAEKENELAFKINRDGPMFLAKAASSIGSVIIHLSTDYVFEGNKSEAYTEIDPVNPQGIYGASKLAGENAVSEFCEKYIILRTAWVFSEHGNNFVKTMIRLSRERDSLGVVSDQFGGPTYAGDIAKAIEIIMNRVKINEEIEWGIYHYSGTPYVSWFEFAKEIFDKARKYQAIEAVPTLSAISSGEFPTPAKRPKNSKLNCSKIKSTFNIDPSDWTRMLNDISNYN